jgi:hypothetical protein
MLTLRVDRSKCEYQRALVTGERRFKGGTLDAAVIDLGVGWPQKEAAISPS